MEIVVDQDGDVGIVRITGDINGATCGRLEEQLLSLIDGGMQRIVLEFSGVRYVSSAGLRVVLIAAKRLFGGGSLVVAQPNPAVRQLFDVTGFSRIVELADDLEAARQTVAG